MAHKENKIVYVLISDGKDVYYAMARVSLASVRISNPKAAIIWITDKWTYANIKSASSNTQIDVDDIIFIDTPSGNALYRSRYIKTSIYRYIDMPYLYLDVDTFVRDDLSDIFSSNADIVGATNHSMDNLEEQICNHDRNIMEYMQWCRGDFYLNTGVLFFNHSRAETVCSLWHKRWDECYHCTGRHYDQPAFNAVLNEVNPKVEILSHRFNDQIKMKEYDRKIPIDSAIWHYYSSNGTGVDDTILAFEALVQRVLAGATIDSNTIKAMVDRRDPLRRDDWLDDLVAGHAVRRGRLVEWEKAWFMGYRSYALRGLFKAMVYDIRKMTK